MPPEAWGTIGYVIGGLLLILVSRRGDVEKITDKAVQKAFDQAAAPRDSPAAALPRPSSWLGSPVTGVIDDTNPRLTLLFLERLSRDFEREQQHTRSELARLWDELNQLKHKE